MYSHTWTSRDAFNEHLRQRTRRYSFADDRLAPDEMKRRLDALATDTDVLTAAVESGAAGTLPSESARAGLAALSKEYEQRYGEALTLLHVTVTERVFDWSRGAFAERPDLKSTGTLEVGAGLFHSSTTGAPLPVR
jgi:hypothetical protein